MQVTVPKRLRNRTCQNKADLFHWAFSENPAVQGKINLCKTGKTVFHIRAAEENSAAFCIGGKNMSKKKKIKVGTIPGIDLVKKTRPPQDIPFRTGGYKTEKDRPRKRYSPRDVE